MTPRARPVLALLALACLVGLLAGAPAAAAEPAAAEVGVVRLATPPGGGGALLVPVRYPIQLSGQRAELRLTLRGAGPKARRSWRMRVHLNSGLPRSPDRRRRFVFVHRVDVGPALARRLSRAMRPGGPRPRVRVSAPAVLDIDRDGSAEVSSTDVETQRLGRRSRAGRRQCSDIRQPHARSGRRLVVSLPVCGAATRWRLARKPENGFARIARGKLIYKSSRRFAGTEKLVLRAGRGAVGRGSAQESAAGPSPEEVAKYAIAPFPIKVHDDGGGKSVRAIGDSVTAGFGYYDDGSLMSFFRLFDCKPPEVEFDDACSSNSVVRSNEVPEVEYAPDYGLSNNVSWAAQYANEHGAADYKNLAVSGSEPSNWLPGGQFYSTANEVKEENPDFILMTMGANPLLSEMLFGLDDMGCAIFSDIDGDYAKCIEENFEKVALNELLRQLYEELVESTDSTVFLMQYHLSVPSIALAYSVTQIGQMVEMLNGEIATIAEEVDPSGERLQVVSPPHFSVGVEMEPVYRDDYSCGEFFDYEVDGPSVQSNPTQDELEILHPASFCSSEGPPWIISGDTGIHPSAVGYTQMAESVPHP